MKKRRSEGIESLRIVDKNGKKVGEIKIAERLACCRVSPQLINEVIVGYRRNRRQGTASTKSRGEVTASGRKPWRQKGTGRARAGTSASPIWKGGGVTFGPKPRNYGRRIPHGLRKKVLAGVLAAKLRDGQLVIVDKVKSDSGKTKDMVAWLDKIGAGGRSLIVMGEIAKDVEMATRNISGTTLISSKALNASLVVVHEKIVVSKNDFEALQERMV